MKEPYGAVLTTQLHRYIDHASDGFSFALKLVRPALSDFFIYPVITREDDSQIPRLKAFENSLHKKLMLPRSYFHRFYPGVYVG